jgi:DNA-binding MarR family transcriptional regulator
VSATRDQQELSEAILALARAYQLRDRNRICRHGITVSQCYALEHIAANEGVTVSGLATALSLDKSTTSRVVEGLRSAGLADFVGEAMHRREKPIAATVRGVALNKRIHAEILDEHLKALARFSPRDRRACRDLLQAIAAQAVCRISGTTEPPDDQKRPGRGRRPNRRNL